MTLLGNREGYRCPICGHAGSPCPQHDSAPQHGQCVSDAATARELALAWANGSMSHINEFMAMEGDCENRPHTLAAIAQADAAEVVKWSALAQLLMAEEREKWASRA